MTHIANLDVRVEEEKQLLLAEMLGYLKQWRTTQRTFKAVTDAYTDRYADPVTAETKASRDPRRIQAQDFGGYYRDCAAAAAVVLTAIYAREGKSFEAHHDR